jgi:two-component system NarL family sensor kinase
MDFKEHDILVFLIVITLLILVLGILIIRLVYLYHKKQLDNQVDIVNLNVAHEKKITIVQLEVQEKVSKEIALEIHDNIIHTLRLAGSSIKKLKRSDEGLPAIDIDTLEGTIESSIDKLRNLSHGLNPDMINRMGLIVALQEEMQKIRDCNPFTVNFEISGLLKAESRSIELAVFRIIQELFTNIIKHSEAKNVSLFLQYREDCLEFVVKDDGKGFQYPLPENSFTSTGLINIQTRIDLLSGKMNIRSEGGEGTVVEVCISYGGG